jgi:rod shape-determining protein MreC
MLFTWFMLAGFIFLFAPQTLTNRFQLAFARIFRRPLSIGRNISLSARTRQPFTDQVSRREYNRLQNHLANVVEQWNREHKKVEELSRLRDRLAWESANVVLADIITASINGLHSELIIDRGENDGLSKGQFIIGDNSIIGTISDISARTAKVRLITDSGSKMAVRIAGLDINRIMQGNGNNLAKVKLLQISHKVEVGDKVYAEKRPGLLDNSMIVGTVAECKIDDENPSLWDITVKPACQIDRLTDVAVIVMKLKP